MGGSMPPGPESPGDADVAVIVSGSVTADVGVEGESGGIGDDIAVVPGESSVGGGEDDSSATPGISATGGSLTSPLTSPCGVEAPFGGLPTFAIRKPLSTGGP